MTHAATLVDSHSHHGIVTFNVGIGTVIGTIGEGACIYKGNQTMHYTSCRLMCRCRRESLRT